MRRMLLSALACLFLVVPALGAGPRPTRYELDVRFLPAEARAEGQAILHFAVESAREISFYLHGELRLTSARLGEATLEFNQEPVFYPYDYSLIADRVTIPLDGRNPSGLELSWEGYFHPSRARAPSDYMRIDETGVYLRGYYYSPWFPVFLEQEDDEYPVEFSRVTVRTPAAYTAVFAGTLLERKREGQEQLSVWSGGSLLPSDAQLGAREYGVIESEGRYVYSLTDAGSRAVAGRILNVVQDLDRRFRSRYAGDAEPSQLHVAQLPRFGDISSGNMVGLADQRWAAFDEDPGAMRTLAHELVHAYVHLSVPRSDPLYALVVEGVPAYFHWPVLAEIQGEESYAGFMDAIEASYLEKRRTGKDRRGNPLPVEIPLLEIGPDQIGTYKDLFVLSDRARLFFDYLRRRMGPEPFYEFAADLFARERLDLGGFRAVVGKHLPESEEDLRLWLETSEYPERFLRKVARTD